MNMKALKEHLKELLLEGKTYRTKDLADVDCNGMGSMYSYYIDDNRCTIEDWCEAGKSWAQDELDNENINKDEYDKLIEYYDSVEDIYDLE